MLVTYVIPGQDGMSSVYELQEHLRETPAWLHGAERYHRNREDSDDGGWQDQD